MRKTMPIAAIKRLNRENDGRFFDREHGSRYSDRAWLDTEGRAWFWYTNEGSFFNPARLDLRTGRVLPEYPLPALYTAAEAVAWIKGRV